MSYKYICDTCHKVTVEDVWYCENCSDESHIIQVVVQTFNEKVAMIFHEGISIEDATRYISYLTPDNCSLSHSQFANENYDKLMFVFNCGN